MQVQVEREGEGGEAVGGHCRGRRVVLKEGGERSQGWSYSRSTSCGR